MGHKTQSMRSDRAEPTVCGLSIAPHYSGYCYYGDNLKEGRWIGCEHGFMGNFRVRQWFSVWSRQPEDRDAKLTQEEEQAFLPVLPGCGQSDSRGWKRAAAHVTLEFTYGGRFYTARLLSLWH